MPSKREVGAASTPLTRAAGEHLLRLLEQAQSSVAGSMIEDAGRAEHHQELISRKAVVSAGSARTWPLNDDDGIRYVDLEWNAERKAYFYFCASDGFVFLPPDQLAVYRVDMDWWLAWLSGELKLANSGKPYELVAGHAWDLGDLWVTNSSKVRVVFVRRMRNRAIEANLCKALEVRAGRRGGIVLTSCSRPLADIRWPREFFCRRIADMLTTSADSFSIDPDLLKAPYLGGAASRIAASAVSLSPDGRVLTIMGEVFPFSGKQQRRILRILVDAYGKSIRTPSRDVLTGSADTLAKVFKGNTQWPQLQRFVRQKGGFCWIEL